MGLVLHEPQPPEHETVSCMTTLDDLEEQIDFLGKRIISLDNHQKALLEEATVAISIMSLVEFLALASLIVLLRFL